MVTVCVLSLEIEDSGGNSFLKSAIMEVNPDIDDLFLKCERLVDKHNEIGDTALHVAARLSKELTQQVVRHGPK